ncbi:uncharacterized protein LOC114872815 isoform X2 [Osmia bicornis bicornis]|nr:uncharacterized protein LOC114872815 isoform X2 [Osmia bicornis bicornis]XP_029036291.2 uncharacterized protein LOC114872815 isoform X2 [Osmia bicornis bicornis]XP_029036292.2 uncharacterized protein LOC114872815 isoform X2 [Osmia bicornis bicornis]XP_029036293.2 uncharacterized protein LOC114872815 isoform X2 [Osmia bicornis bicornis]XP_029036294.2 uncharacterized protein LOC114872815 isoform X2 [Osmia bicornis bicornis]
MDERMQAISFANSYFALVDGLASGLENHLSEDVVLDWFGRTVRGRRNVTTFIEAHKVNSRHIFSEITPVAGIGYKKKHFNRKKIHSYHKSLTKDVGLYNDANKKLNDERFLEESEVSPKCKTTMDINQNEIVTKVASEMDDMSYDLCEGDLSNLFKLEIASTNIEEIEQSINRIKLEEEMAPTVKAVKRECGQGDGPAIVETSTIKYVEADGEIEFSRKFWKRDAWNAYITAASNVHTWRRPCKLQIAYTTLVGQPALELSRRSRNTATRVEQPKTRLPSLLEINEISNRLIPNEDHFGGFLKEIDFYEDRKEFLKNLGTQMMSKDPDTPLFAPRYVENKLVFNKPCGKISDKNRESKKKFSFNYQIHLIIYEGTNKCRMNLLHEFEKARI